MKSIVQRMEENRLADVGRGRALIPTPDEKEKKALDWSDQIPDPDEGDEGYEPTYRDGSAKNECWDDRAWSDRE